VTRFKRQTKQSKATAILAADLHIRPDTPVCRTDDYWAAQERKIDFILDLRKQHDCPLLVAGDLGNFPLNNGWPTWLLEWTINKFEGHEIIAIPGQHDLPNHKIELFEKSGMGVLDAAGAIKTIFEPYIINLLCSNTFTLYPFSYSQEIDSRYCIDGPINIAMTHQMVIENKPLWPGQEAPRGHQLLKKFPSYNLILSGDNHHPFIAEYEGRLLVNPGSLMRMTADQEDHKPRVYLWYAETNEIEAVYLPIEQGVISREHIEAAEDRTNRFATLIERVREDVEIQLSYTDNLERYFGRFRTQKQVKEKIWGVAV